MFFAIKTRLNIQPVSSDLAPYVTRQTPHAVPTNVNSLLLESSVDRPSTRRATCRRLVPEIMLNVPKTGQPRTVLRVVLADLPVRPADAHRSTCNAKTRVSASTSLDRAANAETLLASFHVEILECPTNVWSCKRLLLTARHAVTVVIATTLRARLVHGNRRRHHGIHPIFKFPCLSQSLRVFWPLVFYSGSYDAVCEDAVVAVNKVTATLDHHRPTASLCDKAKWEQWPLRPRLNIHHGVVGLQRIQC